MGLFAAWQPLYAERGVPSFPVVDKKPAIKGYLKVGLPGSGRLAAKFSGADAFGIPLSRSNITVLDVDTPDENVFADAMIRFGQSPFIVRSGSGNWQAWYRNSGEGRQIRPDKSVPVDILGAGYVVAPPSKVAKGEYAIVEGDLDVLPALPAMRGAEWSDSTTYNSTLPPLPSPLPGHAPDAVTPGQRNTALWRFMMGQAPYCDDADALIDVGVTANAAFGSPLPDDEVVKTALSAWKYEVEGKNWIARGRRRPPPEVPDGLMFENSDAFVLWNILRFFHSNRSDFRVSNEMANTMPDGGWPRKRLSAARRALLEHGHITLVKRASTGRAAVHAWGRQS
jgi:hypothetical protein